MVLIVAFADTEKSLPADVRDVLDAAALLEVTEFRLFKIAYQFWHGRDASDHSIEQFFVPYMFRSVVPLWVRQLCRQILQANAEGRLNPASYGVKRRQQRLPATILAIKVIAVVGAVLLMLLLAGSLYVGY
ncbi:MAG: hypothetical protein ACE5K1_08800 [Acidiferrobacterales bacterium]